MVTNPQYQRSVTELSSLIMDQPHHPLEVSVWWLEYLLRHPHNQEMKPHTHNLNWVQYFLIDVIAFIVFVVTVLITIIVKLIRCCCLRNRRKNKTE